MSSGSRMTKKRILFICLGNICRSPTAEAVFKHKIKMKKIESHFSVDSAGTSANHIGEDSDRRSIKHASKRGYVMDHKARQFKDQDFSDFDLLVCMDDQNFQNIFQRTQTAIDQKKVVKMASYLKKYNDNFIVDPWPLGTEAFEKVIDLLEDACENLLNELQNQ